MIKIGQSKNLYVKSFTEDNFPYLEVFFDSSKKTIKGRLELQRVSVDPKNKNFRRLHFTQKVQVIYSSPVKTHGNTPPEEDVLQEKDIHRVSSTVFTKTYSCIQSVPANVTAEMVQDKILSNKRACLYSVISNSPINPQGPGKAGELPEEVIKAQILKYHEDEEPHKKGDLFLDKYGKPQYRMTLLSLTGQSDIDLRSSREDDYFIPEYLKSTNYGRK